MNSIWHYDADGVAGNYYTGLTRPRAEALFGRLKETIDAHEGSGAKLLSTTGRVLEHYKGK